MVDGYGCEFSSGLGLGFPTRDHDHITKPAAQTNDHDFQFLSAVGSHRSSVNSVGVGENTVSHEPSKHELS
jgi:hypothetical protein